MNLKDRTLLVELYNQQPLAVDSLPYTVEFVWLLGQFNDQALRSLTSHDLFQELVRARKDGLIKPRDKEKGNKLAKKIKPFDFGK